MAQVQSGWSKYRGVLTITAVAALFSATGVAEPDALALLQNLGVPEALARFAAHAAPVVLTALVLSGAVIATRGRGHMVRFGIFLVAGGFVGFITAWCVELLAGVGPLLTAFAGPLGEATLTDRLAWVFVVFCVSIGALMIVTATLGSSGAGALQIGECDAEALDVRQRDRAVYGWASLGMIGQGAAVAGLALMNQSLTTNAPGLAVAIGGAAAFTLASVMLWRGYDELLRRVVVDSYSISAVIATFALFAWVAAELAGFAPALEAYSALLAFFAVQTAVTMTRSARMMGSGNPMTAGVR